ncbi:hypothetical protein HDU97_004868 [Phlyctochytrium planicorne]|nr:hypothetical protein HDU97_004868 [Phlyctochytrium planicorne]
MSFSSSISSSSFSNSLSVQSIYATKFTPILSDHETILENLSVALNVTETTMLDLEDAGTHKEQLDQLEDAFKGVLDLMHQVEVQRKVVEKVKSMLVNGTDVEMAGKEGSRLNSYVKTEVEKKMKAYHALSDKEKYWKVQPYIDLKKRLWEPFRMDGSSSNDDDDLEIVAEQSSYICPISAALMEDPYTSKVCNHSYSKIILDVIRKSYNGKTECPVSGCNKVLRLTDLVRDKVLARKIERYKESQESFGVEDDEEEE